MGFGSDGFGAFLFAIGELPLSATKSPVLPRALSYDGASGRIVYDANAELVDLHPVDHWVMMQVSFELGSIPGAPTIGNRIRQLLSRAPRAKRASTVLYGLRECLGPAIDRRDIALGAVALDTPRRDVVSFEYTNLRTGRLRPTLLPSLRSTAPRAAA